MELYPNNSTDLQILASLTKAATSGLDELGIMGTDATITVPDTVEFTDIQGKISDRIGNYKCITISDQR